MNKLMKALLATVLSLNVLSVNVHAEDDEVLLSTEADTECPELVVSTIQVNPTDAVAGDNVTVSFKATDNEEMRVVWLYYEKPQTKDQYKVNATYNESTGYYEGTIVIDDSTESGVWKIHHFDLEDTSGNEVFYYNNDVLSSDKFDDLSLGDFTVTGTHADIENPVLDVSSIEIDKIDVVAGDTVTVRFIATDNVGLATVKLYYEQPQTKNQHPVNVTYNESTGYYEGTIVIDDSSESGEWRIHHFDLKDTSNHAVSYYNTGMSSGVTYDLSAGNFTVTGTQADIEKPVLDISSIQIDKTDAVAGDTVTITFKASDNEGMPMVLLYYVKPETDNSDKTIKATYNENTGYYEVTINIDNSTEIGEWKIHEFVLRDYAGNEERYNNKEEFSDDNNYDLSAGDFTVHNYSSEWIIDVKATCTTDGSESRHCSACNSTIDVRPIIATGHKEETLPAVSATCTKTGLTAGKKCSVCKKIIVAQKTIAKTAHTYNIYGKCTKCGTYAAGISTKVPSMKIKSISKAKGALTVKWAKNTKVKGYQIRYSLKSDMSGAKTVNISKNKTTSKKISKLYKKTKYYVQIRAYALVNGKTMYSPWSAVKSQTTK